MVILSTILDIIFPTYCLSCGQKGADLCLGCLADSPEAERESALWIFPLFDYRHPPLKKAIHSLKYRGRHRLARIFADAMYGRILEEIADLSIMENFKEPMVVPIPLSSKRRRERGFNQAELICKELIKLDGSNKNFELAHNILIKPKDTAHQAHIENRNARLKNLIGSFTVLNPKSIVGRNLILIDDVTTTGATLNEAKKTLRQAGARKIIAFTLAH